MDLVGRAGVKLHPFLASVVVVLVVVVVVVGSSLSLSRVCMKCVCLVSRWCRDDDGGCDVLSNFALRACVCVCVVFILFDT